MQVFLLVLLVLVFLCREQQAQREETLKASPEGPIPQGFTCAPISGSEQSTCASAQPTDGDDSDCGVRGACDTVGAVAIDCEGNVAAATSTGGYINKMPGRVGDSPCVGRRLFAFRLYRKTRAPEPDRDPSTAIINTSRTSTFI